MNRTILGNFNSCSYFNCMQISGNVYKRLSVVMLSSTREPSTIQELRAIVCPDPSKSRLKFVRRIVHILNFVSAHPETVTTLGAAWCRDGKHFVVNSKILGIFLNLKSNSINTNFRDHGFQIVTCQSLDLQKDFPVLTDLRHWKKRYTMVDWFRAGVDPMEADKMMSMLDKVERPNPEPVVPWGSGIPESLGINSMMFAGVWGTLLSIPQKSATDSWPKEVLDTVYKFWVSRLGRGSSWTAPIALITDALCEDTSYLTENEQEQLCVNLEFLLLQKNQCSQVCESDVTFENFFKFFLRYGSKDDWTATLREITYFNQSSDGLTFGLNSFESQGRYETRVQFKSWFSPSSDRENAIANLRRTRDEAWIVKPSNTPSYFIILYKEEGETEATGLHIIYNCLAAPGQRFAVEYRDGNRAYQPSFYAILTETLGLTLKEEKSVAREVQTRYVSADEFTSKVKKNAVKTPPVEQWMDDFSISSQSQASQTLTRWNDSQLSFSQFM